MELTLLGIIYKIYLLTQLGKMKNIPLVQLLPLFRAYFRQFICFFKGKIFKSDVVRRLELHPPLSIGHVNDLLFLTIELI